MDLLYVLDYLADENAEQAVEIEDLRQELADLEARLIEIENALELE